MYCDGLQIWIMGDLKPTLAWNWLWFYPPKNVLRCFRVNAHLLWEEIWANSIFYWLRLDRALKVFFSSGDTVRKVHTILNYRKGCSLYILDSSNSSSITFWTSQFSSSCRSNWTGIWSGNSNGSWTDKQSSHFSTVKEMSVKATFLFR